MKRSLKIIFSVLLATALLFAGWVMNRLHKMSTGDVIRCSIRKDAVGRFLCGVDLRVFRKIDPTELNRDGDSLLQQVFYNFPSVPPDPAGDARAYETADWLIKEGASIEATNRKGMTLLMNAVVELNVPLVKFLVSRGANPSAKGAGEFAELSASALADRISETNLKIARGLLSCDKELLTAPYPQAASNEVGKVLRYEHFRVQRYVAGAAGKSPRAADCQPSSPEETERIMTQMGPILGLAEIRSLLGVQALQ